MPAPSPKPTAAADPFGFASSLHDWCCLLKAAREIRDIDAEMMETMIEARAGHPAPSATGKAPRRRSLRLLLRSLGLDPAALRRRAPEAMRELEAACMRCPEHERCSRELQAGTARLTYPAFCPNAPRIDRLRRD
ncbi:MAG: heavy-metal resistance [Parafilimonas terrae]|nr:heavy-metal resistance [Parafilimonas terrae]